MDSGSKVSGDDSGHVVQLGNGNRITIFNVFVTDEKGLAQVIDNLKNPNL